MLQSPSVTQQHDRARLPRLGSPCRQILKTAARLQIPNAGSAPQKPRNPQKKSGPRGARSRRLLGVVQPLAHLRLHIRVLGIPGVVRLLKGHCDSSHYAYCHRIFQTSHPFSYTDAAYYPVSHQLNFIINLDKPLKILILKYLIRLILFQVNSRFSHGRSVERCD